MHETLCTMNTPTLDSLTLEAAHGSGVYGSRGISLVRGEGVHLFDESGKRYLDCTAAFGVASLGHAHPELVSDLREQLGRLWNCQGSFANEERANYARELCAALPEGFERVFLCNSGTEATEAALKFARFTTKRPAIVACMRGFHGRTMGSLSATWDRSYREPFAPLVPEVRHIPYDKPEALDEALTDKVAAFIVEVVQGEGGVRVGSPEFLQKAQELCRARGVMLILDEVQTGFGRTGRLFALEHHDLEPDLVCLAKGIAGGFPAGAVALGTRIAELPVGAHGSTFGGNPLACRAARTLLAIMQRDDIPARVAEKSDYLFEGLHAIDNSRIREVRGKGFLVGIELKERATPYVRALQERGILTLNAGPNVLRLLPPLILEREHIDQVVNAIEAVLAEGAGA